MIGIKKEALLCFIGSAFFFGIVIGCFATIKLAPLECVEVPTIHADPGPTRRKP